MRAGAQRRPGCRDQSRHRACGETRNGPVGRSRASRSVGDEVIVVPRCAIAHLRMRLLAQARYPQSRSWLWIPGSLVSLGPRNDSLRKHAVIDRSVRHHIAVARVGLLDSVSRVPDKDSRVDRERTMTNFDRPLARRAVIKGAGLGLVAGGLADALPTQSAVAATAEGDEIWSSEYWARKGDIPLWMYRKRLGAPKAGEPSRPVLFFVHGSSVSSRAFDLNVPGHGEYSVMNEFARYGFDCWTMDHENYGKSGRTSGNSDIASGVEDLKAAVEVFARETGRQKFHFLGQSSGALRAGAYAMVAPERADRLGVR